MSLKSAPYYWIECDHPGCGARSTEGGDYAAWADHGAAYDEAVNEDWHVSPSGSGDYCHHHAPDLCCACDEVATTEHEGQFFCDGCIAELGPDPGASRPGPEREGGAHPADDAIPPGPGPDVYETAAQRVAAPDRSFIPAEDVIADPTTEETP